MKDIYTLEKIKDLSQGNDEFIKIIISTFLGQLPSAIKQMKNQLDSGDYQGLSKEAHKLKPSIDLFSIYDGVELVRFLENEKQVNTPDELKRTYLKLEDLLLKVKTLLESERLK